MSKGRVLFVDDDAAMGDLVASALAMQDLEVRAFTSGADAVSAAETFKPDVVVTDLNMPRMDGIEVCRRLQVTQPDTPVIVCTAFGSLESAIAALRAGAYDFLTKPIDMDDLTLRVERALEHRLLRQEVTRLRRAVKDAESLEDMVGSSPPMTRVYDLIRRVARTDVNVLVTGETGTGKELVAHAIHTLSDRSGGPFVPVNCAAMPDALLESELFGHAKGSFTDAKQRRAGLLVEAHQGTVFLDEIAEMSIQMQAKLLRALQERKVRPVGQNREVPFDARIITATNRELEEDISEGDFREDLYYRINVVNVRLPPLRARGNDVLLLAQHFLEQFRARHGVPVESISPEAADRLLGYDWPGNVRELQNCIERAVALAAYESVRVEDLPRKIREHQSTRLDLDGTDPENLPSMEEVERRYIHKVLQAVEGNKTTAAEILGLDRKTLYRKLKRYAEMGS